jgi:tetratricopeptide (TPR) repeat protein
MKPNRLRIAARLGRVLGCACFLMAGVVTTRASGDEAAGAAPVKVTATDTKGGAVRVPDGDRTTVFLFLLAGQPQSAQAITALRATVARAPGARVVAVVGGAETADQVRRLEAEKLEWPIVADAEHALSGKLSVHAWPTTVIVSAQGARMGHVPGLPKAYASNVEAYLDFAAGAVDRAGLERRLASHDGVADGPEQMAARHVRVARRLQQNELFEQSKGELARALALKPTDPAVQAELVELLLAAGDAGGAAGVLERMDGGAASRRVQVLRGRLLIATGKWDEARATLTKAVELNPDPAEALYQLGLVYQHDGDWPRAAEAFRKAFEHTPVGRGATTTTTATTPAAAAPGSAPAK